MFLPTMNDSKVNRVKIPAFSGGFNPGNTGDSVNDNQLIDCKNVWFKGGEVQTRPKIVACKRNNFTPTVLTQSCESIINEKHYKFFVTPHERGMVCNIYSSDKNTVEKITFGSGIISNFVLYKGKAGLVNQHGCGVYVVYNVGEHENAVSYVCEIGLSGSTFDSATKTTTEVAYKPQVILNGLGNLYYKLPRDSESELPKVTQLEGFNLLTGGYRASFTTDSISNSFTLPNAMYDEIKINVNMQSVLSKKFEVISEGDFIKSVEINQIKSTCFSKVTTVGSNEVLEEVGTLTFTIPSGSSESEETYEVNGAMAYYDDKASKKRYRYYYCVRFKASFDAATGELYFPLQDVENRTFAHYDNSNRPTGKDETGADALFLLSCGKMACIDYEYDEDVNLSKYIAVTNSSSNITLKLPKFDDDDIENFVFPRCGDIHNNLEVIVTKKNIANKIVGCNVSTNYGGTVGLNHGTRTFLAGNKNSVYFSDIDNPLYFPENCYLNIGDDSLVTAFAKQDGCLVIYKNRSIVYTYEKSINNEVEDYTNQSVVDITAQYMYPIKSISDSIGCDLPNTIQLCMNRLVWTNKNGEVYTISGLNNYSERNIHCVSDSVAKEIRSLSKVTSKHRVFSADWMGYYMLFKISDDDKKTYVYLLDYNRISYKYVASYTADNKNKFSWWKWELPFVGAVVVDDDDIVLINDENTYTFDIDKLETDCESLIRTKFFDFSAPDYYKGIEKVSVCLGNDYDSSVCLKFLTEKGELLHSPSEIYKTGERGTASYMTERNYYPRIKLCKRFGIEISSNGPMSISSVILNYNMKGSVKNGI